MTGAGNIEVYPGSSLSSSYSVPR